MDGNGTTAQPSRPGPAGRPEATRVGSHYVSLKWQPPSHTTSALPVVRYRVALRSGGDFIPLHETADAVCFARVTAPADSWCEFTVSALTERGGSGASSLPSVPVLTKASKRKGGRRQKRRHAPNPHRTVSKGGDGPGSGGGGGGGGGGGAAGDGDGSGGGGGGSDDGGGRGGGDGDGGGGGGGGGGEVGADGRAAKASLPPPQNSRFEELRSMLRAWERDFEKLEGRRASEEDMEASGTYRRLALEYVDLRDARDREESGKAARQRALAELQGAGLDVHAHVTQLELQLAQWDMSFHSMKARPASAQDRLSDRTYVSLHTQLVAARHAASRATQALTRVSSFDVVTTLAAALFEAREVGDAQRLRSAGGILSVTLDALDTFSRFDVDADGALRESEFHACARAELEAVAGPRRHRGGKEGGGRQGKQDPLSHERLHRMFLRADADGDGFVDFNEFFHFVRPHEPRALASSEAVPSGRGDATTVAQMIDRVSEELEGFLKSKLTFDGGKTVRTLTREAAAKRRAEAERRGEPVRQQREREAKRTMEAADAAVLTEEYVALLRGHIAASVEIFGEDLTTRLDAAELRAVMRQFRRFDANADGRLDFAEFAELCSRVANAHGRELTRMQLVALFNQADVDRSVSIDINEWCLARGKLMETIRGIGQASAPTHGHPQSTRPVSSHPRAEDPDTPWDSHDQQGQRQRGEAADFADLRLSSSLAC